jgi:hypothetical protein
MSHASQQKLQNAAAQSFDQLRAMEQDLIRERDAKVSELDAKRNAILAADRQRDQVQRLIETLIKGKQNQILKLAEINEEEEVTRKRMLDERQKLMCSLEAEIEKHSVPLADVKSHYELVFGRSAVIRERFAQKMQEKQRELSEVRYNQLMVRARSRKIQNEIKMIREFIKANRPDLSLDNEDDRVSQEIEKNSSLYGKVVNAKRERIKELQVKCWKLQEELANRDQRKDDK